MGRSRNDFQEHRKEPRSKGHGEGTYEDTTVLAKRG